MGIIIIIGRGAVGLKASSRTVDEHMHQHVYGLIHVVYRSVGFH